ncbi:MFS transporter [Rathayibacter tritici]|uniref:MFS transporter n=1 Tax=Rathayibacter tritici TaxID=33888 RepID=UPI001EED8B8C|nr:MFS transporter [Rathayibacter tritici]
MLLVTNAVNSLGAGLVLPFLWLYLTEVRGFSEWVPATVLAVQAMTAVLGGLVWGALLDVLPRRAVLLVVMLVAALGSALFAVSSSSTTAVVAGVVYGLGVSGVGASLRVMYASTARTPKERALVFQVDFGVFNAMAGLGVLVGGFVTTLPFGDAIDRYSLLYLSDAVTFVLTGVAVFVLIRGHEPHRVKNTSNADRPSYRSVLLDARLTALYLTLVILLIVSVGQIRSGLPAFLTAHAGLSPLGFSVAFALNIAAAVVVQFLVVPHLRVVRRSRLLTAGAVASLMAWTVVAATPFVGTGPALAMAVLATVLLAIGETLAVPITNTLVNELVLSDARGRANALLSICVSTSSVIAPIIAGALLTAWDGLGMIAVMIGASMLAAILTLKTARMIPIAVDRSGSVDEVVKT